MRRAAGGVHAATAWKGAHGNGWRKCGAEGGLCGELKVAGSGRWWLVPSPWHGNKLSLAPQRENVPCSQVDSVSQTRNHF